MKGRRRRPDPLDRGRFPVDPWRLVETGYQPDDLGVTETLFTVANGYLGMRGNPEEGATVVRPRHLPQRLPRDLADPARRGGVRLRPDRSDDRQRPRRQAHEDLRRRRAADLRHRRPRALRALPRLPRRRPAPQPGVAYAVRQAGPRRVHPDGLDDPAAPRADDPRGRDAHRRRPDRDLLADPQPPGRHRRVPGRRAARSARAIDPRKAAAFDGRVLLPRMQLRHATTGCCSATSARNSGMTIAVAADHDLHDRRRARDRRPRRRGPGQGGLPGRGHPGQHHAAGEDRRLPLLARRAGPRALRPLRPHPRPGRPARPRALPRRAAAAGTPTSGRRPTWRSTGDADEHRGGPAGRSASTSSRLAQASARTDQRGCPPRA